MYLIYYSQICIFCSLRALRAVANYVGLEGTRKKWKGKEKREMEKGDPPTFFASSPRWGAGGVVLL